MTKKSRERSKRPVQHSLGVNLAVLNGRFVSGFKCQVVRFSRVPSTLARPDTPSEGFHPELLARASVPFAPRRLQESASRHRHGGLGVSSGFLPEA